jgi:hypothetical protein
VSPLHVTTKRRNTITDPWPRRLPHHWACRHYLEREGPHPPREAIAAQTSHAANSSREPQFYEETTKKVPTGSRSTAGDGEDATCSQDCQTTYNKEGRGPVTCDRPLPHVADPIQLGQAKSGVEPPPPEDVVRRDRPELDDGCRQWGWVVIGPSATNARREREPHRYCPRPPHRLCQGWTLATAEQGGDG